MDTQPITVRLPLDLYEQLRREAYEAHAKMTPIIITAIREHLDRDEAAELTIIKSRPALIISAEMAMELRPITLTTPNGQKYVRLLRELREAAGGTEET